jgi:glycosyltransferase involved in cell wall biosynthesis/thymidylate kinase
VLSDVQHFDPRLRVLFQIFAELESHGVDFALIHGEDGEWPSVASDVDIAFAAPPPTVLEPILKDIAKSSGFAIVQRLHYDVPHAYYYTLQILGEPTHFLHLDCLYDPLGINRYRLTTQTLLKDAASNEYGRHSGKQEKAIYLLLKRAIKGKITEQGLANLRNQFADVSDTLWSEVENWFGPSARADVERLLASDSPALAGPQLAKLSRRASAWFRRRHPLRASLAWCLDLWRKTQRFFQPTGIFVVLIGPDGSGKSTIAGAVLSELERAFRRTWRFHWRPSLLPKLRRSSDETPMDNVPAEKFKYGYGFSLLRFFYYWLDFVIGYWFVIYPKKAQTTLVIGERYFPDMLVHPERYGFRVPIWLMRLAAKCVPSPDLLILLSDEPAVIHARKSELSPAKIAEQIAAYQQELPHWGKSAVIETTGGAESVRARVSELILRECTLRTESRLGLSDATLQWRAFPSAKSVKLWVNDRGTLHNSFGLYHPYVRSKQLVKQVIDLMPARSQHMVFNDRPNPDVANRLVRLTRAIRRVLRDQDLVVSFLTGTPGPHQKLTAQVGNGNRVVCYVKIGKTETVGVVLRHEVETLNQLEITTSLSQCVPKVLGLEEDQDDTLLFLSPPSKPAKKHPLQLDAKDVEFLLRVVGLHSTSAGISQVFDKMGLNAYLSEIRTNNATALAIVEQAVGLLVKHFEKRDVLLTFSHGDYAPWNTLELADGNLFVIDWEYANREAPALKDLLHRVFTPARNVRKLGPRELVNELLRTGTDPALGSIFAKSGLAKAELPAYVLLYLLGQLTSRRHGTGEDSSLLQFIQYSTERAMQNAPRKKVLVSAYACEPGLGSEPGVGWQMCEAISRDSDVWVLTRKNNRDAIEWEMAKKPHPHLHFSYVDLPAWARSWKKSEGGVRVYYYLWQFAALLEARKLMRRVSFDFAQHVTFVNDYMGTFLALLPIPFIWGPIGSGGARPEQVWNHTLQLVFERREYYFKNCVRALDPLLWLSAIRAKLVIGINKEIGQRFPISLFTKHKFVSHTAIGVEQTFTTLRSQASFLDEEFRVISVGNLIRLKNFDMTIRAFAHLCEKVPTARLTVIGHGPLRASLEQLANELGISKQVEFLGQIPRPEVMALMGRSHVFLFPSFEAAGMVVLEALAQGLPTVCMNYGGPGEMVTRDCGFVVELGPSEQMIGRLGDALITLASDQQLCQRMSVAGRRRVEDHYAWENRHISIRNWYARAGVEVASRPGSET